MFRILIYLILATLVGCVPYSESGILQDTKNGDSFKLESFEYLLNQGDQLHIEIKTLDEKLNSMLSGSGGGGNQMMQGGGGASILSPILYLQSYSIDSDGNVNIPFIGYVKVSEMTLEGASKTIQKSVDEKLNNTTVNVKMVSYKIAVHGEVGKQGIVTVFSDRANIFEVTGLAGGITEFGDRKNVQVIRTSESGNVVYKLDLTSKSVFSSKVYYLLPNDVIVVNPLPAKNQRLNLPLLNVVLGTLSTVLGIYLISTR
ncbi:MAG: polysaccharide export outer membrane protein [Arenicella sp.]|jgi:polysaccharide export outer membrane protein